MMWKKSAVVAGSILLSLVVGYLVFGSWQGRYLAPEVFWGDAGYGVGESLALPARVTGFWLTGLAGVILGCMLMLLLEPGLSGAPVVLEPQRFQASPPPPRREGVVSGPTGLGSTHPVSQILRPVLRGTCGEYAGAVFPLQREIVIGRDPQVSSVVIDEARISRRHCTVRYDPGRGGFLVTDYSTGGTFLQPGNRRLTAGVPTVVPPGGSISFNASACRFEVVQL